MKNKDIIFFIIVLICLLAIVGLVFFMKSEVAYCVKNPFVYGAERMGNVYCTCTQYNDQISPARFYFNDTAFVSGINQGVTIP